MALTPQTSDSPTSLASTRFVQEPIAVVGMACRLPGGSNSPNCLWEFLMRGGVAETAVPESRFHQRGHFDGSGKPRTMRPPGAMFMETVDPAAFDAKFFNIAPQDAVSMDPQQRILLEVIYEALENAGIPMEALSGENYGCYVGAHTGDYWDLFARDPDSRPPSVGLGVAATMLSNRVSHFLNIKGPSVPVDTACSSSLVAMDIACKALHNGEINGAIIAAASLILNPEYGCDVGSIRNTHSPTGRCHTFDAKADGYVRAEGTNAVILKRLDDALQAGDPIQAVIRGIANNHNGRTPGIASPSAEGQAAVVRQAYANANITDYSFTGYLECHGTGTLVGDPVEATGASSVFAASRPADQPLLMGSIKSNIGHSELPAGLSGLMKAVMILQTGQIPGNPTFLTPNPHIDFQTLRLQVSREATDFPSMPFRRVGVNCFGFGGSNSHAVMDEPAAVIQDYEAAYTWSHRAQALEAGDGGSRPYLLCFSANDETSLRSYLESMTQHLNKADVSLRLRDLAYTLGTRRSQLFHRAYIVSDQLHLQLPPAVYGKKNIRHPQIGFVFTGQGAQWPEMGRELMEVFEPARAAIRNLDSVLQCLANPPAWSLYDELTEPRSAEHVQQPEYSQPLVTALQIALIVLFRSWGVTPKTVVGHSSGEIAAAFAAGYLTEAEAIVVAYHRGQASKDRRHGAPLGMLAVGLGADEVSHSIKDVEDVQIACYNSPNSVTLSGTASSLHEVKERLTKAGAFARMLQVDMAYHSTFMSEIGETYERLLVQDLPPTSYAEASDTIKMYSSVSGTKQRQSPDIAYWKSNMISPVRFNEAVQSMISEESIDFLLEIGPSGALKGPISQILSSLSDTPSNKRYIPSLSRGNGSINATLAVAGQLYLAGLPIDMAQVNEDAEPRPPLVIVDLPNYSWNHTTKYWAECSASRDWRFKKFVHHDLLGSKVLGTSWHAPTFKKMANLSHVPWLQEYRVGGKVEFPRSGYIAMAVEAMFQISMMKEKGSAVVGVNELGYRLRDVRFEGGLVMQNDAESEMHLSMHPVRGSKGWYEFLVLSVQDDMTTEHASGQIRIQDPVATTASESDRGPLEHTTPGHLWDKAFAETGFDHGPAFRRLQKVETRAGMRHCRSLVALCDPPVPYDPQSLYPIHPAALEGIFQAITPVMCAGMRARLRESLVPSTIQNVIINPSGERSDTGLAVAGVYSGLGRQDTHSGSASLYDHATGSLLVEMEGVSYQPLDLGIDPIASQWLTRDLWIPDITALTRESIPRLRSEDPVTTVLELAAGQRQAPDILEIDIGWGDDESIWFHGPARLAHRRYGFVSADAAKVGQFQQRYGSEKNISFHAQNITAMSFDHKFDLIIVKAASEDETRLALEASKHLLSSDGHVLIAGRVDGFFAILSEIDSGLGFAKIVPIHYNESPYFLCTPKIHTTPKPVHIVFLEPNHLPPDMCTTLTKAGWEIITHTCPALEIPPSSTVLIIDEIFAPVLTQVSDEQWACLHRLITIGCKLLWVTQGAQKHVTEPDNALVWGLFRSIRSEDPSATIMALDVEGRDDPFAAQAVVHVLAQLERPRARWVADNEYAERDGVVYVHRVEPFRRLDEAMGGLQRLAVQDGFLSGLRGDGMSSQLLDGTFDSADRHVEMESAVTANEDASACALVPDLHPQTNLTHPPLTITTTTTTKPNSNNPVPTYLITGGLKGLCGSIALHLASQQPCHIIILSRSGCNDPRSQHILHQLHHLGSTTHPLTGSITRITDVRRAFSKSPTPLRGIIHGAMHLHDRPYDTMTSTEFHIALEAKIHGTWNLHNVAMEKGLSLDFFLLLSSISSVVGSKGQANYAAANCFMDAFAGYRRGLGERCMSVALGVVEDVGVVAGSEDLTSRHGGSVEVVGITEGGLLGIVDVAVGYQIQHQARGKAQERNGDDDISQLITGLRVPQDAEQSGLRFDLRFSRLFVGDTPAAAKSDPLTTAIQTFKNILHSETRQGLLESCLSALSLRLAQMLRWDEDQVEPGQPLSVYGLDSLAAVELRNWIRAEMGAVLKTKEIVMAASLIALGEGVVSRLGSRSGGGGEEL
ncbi:ketoacyl-synt-domain-containing protein [Aspergillus heteromorphus CBS 117.55]|uniref:Ketoacyl-synt-domain-containing protein n=1 Tax=Aspergillus heteromorphus CBS 117.55 TaxID=1448321 RepID=A0A317UXI8_9EURO|nr:ketoacyl-synt-domain-containing protein [Aspergillus heteromorphus CBS 117.55]PWY66001.1 ketoacyl-synt-domain-containing protein [Aspergillus heteromorphus CBS 117.55]